MKHACETPTALAERMVLPCPSPYDLLGPVRTLRKDLGLTANDLAVLTALISFLPRDRHGSAPTRQLALTVVFPSNASLSERANGLDERTLRRSLGRLSAAALIERKTSANGKRFPLRYGGVIRDAFGIDLKPLIHQYAALVARASKRAEDRERLRSLKAEALALRASLLRQEGMEEARLSRLGAIRTLLRRATLTADAVLRLISELRTLGADKDARYGENQASLIGNGDVQSQVADHRDIVALPAEMTGTNGQNDRHTESIRKDFKRPPSADKQTPERSPHANLNRDPRTMAWKDFTHVAHFYPEAPRTPEALTRILFDISRLLRIRSEGLKRGLQQAGAGKLLIVLDYLIARADAIKQPDAYFERMLSTQPGRQYFS